MVRTSIAALLLALSTTVAADDFEFNPATTQQDFDAIVQDVTAALNFKALHPAETNGITGFGIAATASYTPTERGGAWRRASGSSVDELGVIGLKAVKGLPLGFDVGAFFTAVPGTDARLFGGEVRYALLDGGVAKPAISIRAALTRMSGVDDFDFETRNLDISISKGFALITPYAGVGQVWGDAETKGNFGTLVNDYDTQETRTFIGARLGLGILDITPEYERIGDNESYNLLIGLSI